jgi:hypothetical protein
MNDHAGQLIRAAFEAARNAGKSDWYRMTAAVLKNRLLQLTDGQFKESAYGVNTFAEFVASFPDLLAVDSSVHPPIVELLGTEQIPAPLQEKPSSGNRVRPDLWRATVDYSSGLEFIWDMERGKARPALEGEDGRRLPTVGPDDLSEWRRAFFEENQSELLSKRYDLERTRTWLEHGYGTRFLPAWLQGPWNEFTTARVVERLSQWFQKEGLPIPNDLVQPLPEAHKGGKTELEQLREFVIDCVKVMTAQELSMLQLPASAVSRSLRRMYGQ